MKSRAALWQIAGGQFHETQVFDCVASSACLPVPVLVVTPCARARGRWPAARTGAEHRASARGLPWKRPVHRREWSGPCRGSSPGPWSRWPVRWSPANRSSRPKDRPAPARPARPPTRDLSDLNLENLLRLKVITASGGVEEESDLAPANVFTVLAPEIASQGWRSVAEVLEHVPGLYVVNDYVTNNVEVRGASGGLRAGRAS